MRHRNCVVASADCDCSDSIKTAGGESVACNESARNHDAGRYYGAGDKDVVLSLCENHAKQAKAMFYPPCDTEGCDTEATWSKLQDDYSVARACPTHAPKED